MSYKIPLFKLNFDQSENEAVLNVLESKWISTGPKCQELESLFCEKLNCNYAVSLSNCTVALHLAMKLLGIGDGDEVICPSLTFVATVNAIKYVNALPVFADIKASEDITINPDEIRKKISPKTKAIVVMHYAGFSCNMDEIMSIAKEYNLKVIEDACHGPLSEYKGKKLGTIGDIGCFSFFSNKNISTGEGGMLVTNSEEIHNQAKLLRSHGMTTMSYQRSTGHATTYDVVTPGYNYRMDDIHASIGIIQLNKLQDDLIKRIEIRKYYEKLLDQNEMTIPFLNHSEFVSNYIFPIVLKSGGSERRDKIRDELHRNGIQTSVHYPAVHRFSIYTELDRNDLVNTEFVTDHEITLPMFGSLSLEEVQYICHNVNTICRSIN
jgi:dTDP-4-amino-4,6-dideoxygalactose transaminase